MNDDDKKNVLVTFAVIKIAFMVLVSVAVGFLFGVPFGLLTMAGFLALDMVQILYGISKKKRKAEKSGDNDD